MADISDPSFEQPGGDAGQALDWVYVVNSSLYESATFVRSVSTVVVDVVPAFSNTGISIQTRDDGTSFLNIAVGTVEGFESFEFGWKSNQFYELALPLSNSEVFTISGAKHVEDFQSGWRVELRFVVGEVLLSPFNIAPVLPLEAPEMPINLYEDAILEIDGQRFIVEINQPTFFRLTEPLLPKATVGTPFRILSDVTSPQHDGFLNDLDLLETELQDEQFEFGWPWLKTLPADGDFNQQFNYVVFGQIVGTSYNKIASLPSPDYANSFMALRYQAAPQDQNAFGRFTVHDKSNSLALFRFSEDPYFPNTINDRVGVGATTTVIPLQFGGFTDHSPRTTRNVIGRVLTLTTETRKIIDSTDKTVTVDEPFSIVHDRNTPALITLDTARGTLHYMITGAATNPAHIAHPPIEGKTAREIISAELTADLGSLYVLGDPGDDLARAFFAAP